MRAYIHLQYLFEKIYAIFEIFIMLQYNIKNIYLQYISEIVIVTHATASSSAEITRLVSVKPINWTSVSNRFLKPAFILELSVLKTKKTVVKTVFSHLLLWKQILEICFRNQLRFLFWKQLIATCKIGFNSSQIKSVSIHSARAASNIDLERVHLINCSPLLPVPYFLFLFNILLFTPIPIIFTYLTLLSFF